METNKMVYQCALALLLAAALVWGGVTVWRVWFLLPYCVETDCQGREIDMETIRQWEKEERQGARRILRLAGWRMERQQPVTAVSTGRKGMTQVMGVYGSMELLNRPDLLCGRYGLAVEADFCVLSEALARDLFGGVQVMGETVGLGTRKLAVAGVIREEENVLLMPIEGGIIQHLVVELEGRSQAEKRVEGLMEGMDVIR